jgi:hypothetical protein
MIRREISSQRTELSRARFCWAMKTIKWAGPRFGRAQVAAVQSRKRRPGLETGAALAATEVEATWLAEACNSG